MKTARYRIMYLNYKWSPWMTDDEFEKFLKDMAPTTEVLGIHSEEYMTRQEAKEKYGIELQKS